MAKDKNGKDFAIGQTVTIKAEKPSPWSTHKVGKFSGVVSGLHEEGPIIELKDGTVIVPFADECEVSEK